MSIDALVFCDCLERGAVRRPPSADWQVFIHHDGCRECGSADPRSQAAFGLWHETACGHDYGILAHRRLASPEALATMRNWLSERGLSGQLPVLVGSILAACPGFDGYLPVADVRRLAEELGVLRSLEAEIPATFGGILARLEELVMHALRVAKPLVI